MKRWIPALALLWLLAPVWAGDIRSVQAPEPLPTGKPIVPALDPSAPAIAPIDAQVSVVPPAALEATQLPQPAVPSATAPAPAAQAKQAGQEHAAAAAQPAEANQWNGVFDGTRVQEPLALDFPATIDQRVVSALVKRAQSAEFPGVKIQQEHEGNLVGGADRRDSSGDVFRYYRPVEMRPELVAQIKSSMSRGEKLGFIARRLTARDDWSRFGTTSKLRYLAALEQAVGTEKAWRGRFSLLLVRDEKAPSYLDEHPQMEETPTHDYDALPYKRYLFPEITTAKDSPAKSVQEAIGRAKRVIGATAHAGVHYHVFFSLPPAELAKRLPEIESLLQLANDAYFAEGAAASPLNLTNRSLSPWHRGRSRRVEELVARAAEEPSASKGQDPDSEKHVPVAFRYWGTKDGLMTVSFELRAVDIPWVRRGGVNEMVKGVEGGSVTIERDYAKPERQLALLAVFANALVGGRSFPGRVPAVELDEVGVDRLAARRAKELGIPVGSYLSIGDFSRALFGTPRDMDDVLQGLLLPFAAGADEPSARAARDELLDVFLKQSARVKALQRDARSLADDRRTILYQFWSAYAKWARYYSAARERRLEGLLVSLQSAP